MNDDSVVSPFLARSRSRLRLLLYLVSGMTDFSVFVVVFTASRSLADAHAEPWYLGLLGAGLSFVSGVGHILGGWLACRFDGRAVFVSGAAVTLACIL